MAMGDFLDFGGGQIVPENDAPPGIITPGDPGFVGETLFPENSSPGVVGSGSSTPGPTSIDGSVNTLRQPPIGANRATLTPILVGAVAVFVIALLFKKR